MPDWMYMRPSGLITNRPSKPVEPATNVLDGDADAAHLRSLTLAALRLALVPLEQLGAAIERLLDERAGRIARARLADSDGPNFALPSGALMRRIAT